MRHRAIKVVVFLLLGAIVNVAVAWACALGWTGGVGVSFLLLSSYTEQWHMSYGHLDSAGWPARSTSWQPTRIPFQTTAAESATADWAQEPLPLKPEPVGFAFNTIFYAGALWLLIYGPGQYRRMKGKRRLKRGLCPACAYPVGGQPRLHRMRQAGHTQKR